MNKIFTKIHTFMVLVDLKTTSDTLDHEILHEQVRCLGFRISQFKWFESYLSNKILLVSTKSVFSKIGALIHSVGSS